MKIKNLYLPTQDLSKQEKFYGNTLGFPVKRNYNQLIVYIGSSRLIFEEDNFNSPFHFAFNIPFDRTGDALMWLKQRVEILKEGEIEIQDFSAWKAKAMYFYDEDKNIVEFIGREEILCTNISEFSIDSVLSISEIGIPSQNIEKVYQSLAEITGFPLKIYDGSFNRFCAIGDPEGLFICIDNTKKGTWFPTEDKANIVSCSLDVMIDQKEYSLIFDTKENQFKNKSN